MREDHNPVVRKLRQALKFLHSDDGLPDVGGLNIQSPIFE